MSDDLQELMATLTSGKKLSLQCCQDIEEQILERHCKDIRHEDHNKFFYEIQPIITVARYIGDKDIQICFSGKTKRIDGILYSDSFSEQKIEITTAINSNNKEMREVIKFVYGHEPIMSPDCRTWKIREDDMIDNEDYYRRSNKYMEWENMREDIYVPMLQDALKKKIIKSKSNDNYHSSWLGIIFDHPLCGFPGLMEDKQRYFDPMCQAILGSDNRSYQPFSRVFILGVTGTYLFDSHNGKSTTDFSSFNV